MGIRSRAGDITIDALSANKKKCFRQHSRIAFNRYRRHHHNYSHRRRRRRFQHRWHLEDYHLIPVTIIVTIVIVGMSMTIVIIHRPFARISTTDSSP